MAARIPEFRIYRPEGRGTQACLLYLHGGGYIMGGLDSHDGIVAELAAGAGVAVVELEEGGRLLAWIGDTIEEVEIGMPVQVVPRIFDELEEIRVYYTIEQPGTTWGKAP